MSAGGRGTRRRSAARALPARVGTLARAVRPACWARSVQEHVLHVAPPVLLHLLQGGRGGNWLDKGAAPMWAHVPMPAAHSLAGVALPLPPLHLDRPSRPIAASCRTIPSHPTLPQLQQPCRRLSRRPASRSRPAGPAARRRLPGRRRCTADDDHGPPGPPRARRHCPQWPHLPPPPAPPLSQRRCPQRASDQGGPPSDHRQASRAGGPPAHSRFGGRPGLPGPARNPGQPPAP